ncbi:MAG: hypothetical protein K6D37_13045 [Prevotella sp.]|nr:hypothetical protein [Prevotella sp.]
MKKRNPHIRIHSKWATLLTGFFIAFLVTTLRPVPVGARDVLRLWPMAEDVSLTRQQDSVALSFQLVPHQVKIPSSQALLIEPWLCAAAGQDSVALATVCLYGRNAYYHVVRGGDNPLQTADPHNNYNIAHARYLFIFLTLHRPRGCRGCSRA